MTERFLKTTTLAMIAASLCAGFPAAAADMIDDAAAPPLAADYRQYQPVRSAYVYQPAQDCNELLITYRHPYKPHSEIVQFCEPL
ncbi:hypothetical protein [Pararhizobium antarcticum]|uniref:Uncharacterized protein n=1 Tax=Pararhizobium antarcticum TaxID=1798805 RepID=A0A657LVQ1_9HYPH|nr:hypothetical protein [Pararhizobium antarcticum]OJF92009.1 hypothetical protein AX761_05860 [Rhizobium sp. 58]OJF96039.1 hypothetical protein AX760_18460 [Pararhizobium antarcticum]